MASPDHLLALPSPDLSSSVSHELANQSASLSSSLGTRLSMQRILLDPLLTTLLSPGGHHERRPAPPDGQHWNLQVCSPHTARKTLSISDVLSVRAMNADANSRGQVLQSSLELGAGLSGTASAQEGRRLRGLSLPDSPAGGEDLPAAGPPRSGGFVVTGLWLLPRGLTHYTPRLPPVCKGLGQRAGLTANNKAKHEAGVAMVLGNPRSHSTKDACAVPMLALAGVGWIREPLLRELHGSITRYGSLKLAPTPPSGTGCRCRQYDLEKNNTQGRSP